jgi:chemotaxis protein CheD
MAEDIPIASGSQTIIVDMADARTTNRTLGRLGTNILGACGAVSIYDPEARVAGLLHFLLPEARINPQRALANPYMFADTGIPMLFRHAYKLGAVKERIVCKLAGGCNVIDPDAHFTIGQQNQRAAEAILQRNNVAIAGNYMGSLDGLLFNLYLENGRATVTLPGGDEIEL